MKPSEYRRLWEEAVMDVEEAKAGHVREIARLQRERVFLDVNYRVVLGEEPPEYETTYRVTKAG